MRSNLTSHGFKWIPWSSISNASNLQRGDILLNEANHTEFYLGNNKDVASHGYYGHTETEKEISVSSYYYYPWDGVLRYVGNDSTDDNHNSKANLESVTGGTGKINVTGWTINKEATITEEGQKSHHCLDCDAITDVTVIDKISSNDNNKTEDGKEDNKDNIDKGEDNKNNNSVIDNNISGLRQADDGNWYLYYNGKINTEYTGLYCDETYGWWKISGGAIDFGYTGLYASPNYGWWLINGGTIAFDYNGLWNDENYGVWEISGGTINFGYTG